MENIMNYREQKPLIINELTKGIELVKELEVHLDPSSSSNGKLLIKKTLSSLENSLSILNWIHSEGDHQPQLNGSMTMVPIESPSPSSVSGSLLSHYDSDLVRDNSKKRKKELRWTEKVHVCPETGLEGPVDDGYSWRKYGQKNILGAKYPRGYYRCTHRNAEGCLAMKLVQRSDENPSIFSVTYRGKHTCIQESHLVSGQSQQKQNQKQNQEQKQKQKQKQQVKQSRETFINFNAGDFHVKAEDDDIDNKLEVIKYSSSSFSFPCALNSSPIQCLEKENNIFSSLTPDDNHFMGTSFSSPFISPTTSESNYFSPYRIKDNFGSGQSSECDFNEIISAENSVANSPMIPDLDLDMDWADLGLAVGFDPNFPFDISWVTQLN